MSAAEGGVIVVPAGQGEALGAALVKLAQEQEAAVQVHMTSTWQLAHTGVWHVGCRCGWTGGGPTRETAREAGDDHLAAANAPESEAGQ